MSLKEFNTSQQHMVDCAKANGFTFIPAEQLDRDYSDVLLESVLSKKLLELNKGEYVDGESFVTEAILSLRKIINSAESKGMILANKEFFEWINGDHSLKQGKDNKDITVHYIDFENISNNSLIVSTEVNYPRKRFDGGRAFDVVLYINGIPFVIGEAKTPFSEEWTAIDGADDIYSVYQKECYKFFVPSLLCVASDCHQFIYAAIGVDPFKWGPWKLGGIEEDGTSESVDKACASLFSPEVLLDISKYFTMYLIDEFGNYSKIVCRYQQYEGANGIIRRALTRDDNKGLIHHFQGSGKSYLMVFAAQKLREQAQLHNPSVIVVVDRTNLDDQINTDFDLAHIPLVQKISTSEQLRTLLAQDSRYIYVTTIQKFRKMQKNISLRENIYVFADEAHRTQYGNLSEYMRYALPNAMFFGLTGTPICKSDRNTYKTFGSTNDAGGYLSRYDFLQSIKDGETLPLTFIPWKIDIEIDKDAITEAFDELTVDLTEDQRNEVANRASRAGNILRQPKPTEQICTRVKKHFLENVKPNGFKAMLVAQDRFCCVEYKKKLDELLVGTGVETAIVINTEGKDDPLKPWHLSHDEEVEILKRYNDPEDPIGILIVTSKLTTGFNSKILQTQYLAKYIKEHTLLQCITRVNRPYNNNKTHGVIVDFLGIFEDVKTALSYGDIDLEGLLQNIDHLKSLFPPQYNKCVSYLSDFEMADKIEVYDAIKQYFNKDPELRRQFAKDVNDLQKLYNVISPDIFLSQYREGYKWILKVHRYIAPRKNGRALWKKYGPKTLEIIGNSITNVEIKDDFDKLVLDQNLIKKAFEKNPDETVRIITLGLKKRIQSHKEDPIYVALSQRLDILRQAMEAKQINSIESINELLKLTNEFMEAKNLEEKDPHEYAVRVLTTHMEMIMSDKTPEDVTHAVYEIDNFIVGYEYNFDTSHQGKREVSLELMRILMRYGVYTEENLNQTLKYMQLCYAYKYK